MVRVFVIRHAERLDRALEREATDKGQPLTTTQFLSLFARPQNPPLSTGGREMAKKVGHTLIERGVTVDKIYSSPLSRCVQTSDIMANVLGLPQDSPCILLEDGLCEEACSLRFPRPPYLPTRFDQFSISGRVNLDYLPLRPVIHEDMRDRGWQVRNLEKMSPTAPEKRVLCGDPEIHCVRELCPGLPNPFDPAQAEAYREACHRLQLPVMRANPAFEVTLLRVREMLERLLKSVDQQVGKEEKKQQDQQKKANRKKKDDRKDDQQQQEKEEEEEEESFVLVTHGAVTTAVMVALTGEAPPETAAVGTFHELHRSQPPSPAHPLGQWVEFKA